MYISTVEQLIANHTPYPKDKGMSLHEELAQLGLHSVPARGSRRAIRNAYGSTLIIASAHEAWEWLRLAGWSE